MHACTQVIGNLRGFRADKPLPLAVIVQNVGGQNNFKMAVIEQILLDAMEKVGDIAFGYTPLGIIPARTWTRSG